MSVVSTGKLFSPTIADVTLCREPGDRMPAIKWTFSASQTQLKNGPDDDKCLTGPSIVLLAIPYYPTAGYCQIESKREHFPEFWIKVVYIAMNIAMKT